MACPRTTDFQNFYVCGKNQTYVGIANDYLNYHVCCFLPHMHGFAKYLIDMSKYFQILGDIFCIYLDKYQKISYLMLFGIICYQSHLLSNLDNLVSTKEKV